MADKELCVIKKTNRILSETKLKNEVWRCELRASFLMNKLFFDNLSK